MKLLANKLSSYNFTNIKAILLYGPNYGLAEILKATLVANYHVAVTVVNIQTDDLKKNLDLVSFEVGSLGLFEESAKCIVIKNSSDAITKAIQPALGLSPYPLQTLIIVMAGELPASGSLRKLFEARDDCLSVACYLDAPAETKYRINSFLKNNNLTTTKETTDYLANQLSQDSLIAKNSLESLLLYVHPQKTFTIQEIDELLTDQSMAALDKMLNNLFLQNFSVAYQLTVKLLEDFNSIALLKSISNHLYKLHLVKSAVSNGVNIQKALSLVSPPIFFTNVDPFLQQLPKYNLNNLKTLLNNIILLEVELKTKSSLADLLFKNFILNFRSFCC